jgi:sugar phosphate isomerase/epimerase
MQVLKSVCTTLAFPKSRNDIGEFDSMASFLSGRGVGGIEFYYDGEDGAKIGEILAKTGLDPVLIAVIPSKENKLYLCDMDEEKRKAAVKLFIGCIDFCRTCGIRKLMINSGRITEDIKAGLQSLGRSIKELFEYASGKNYEMLIAMEPCDSKMDAFHLIGPYKRALDFTQDLNSQGYPLQLVMDCAHVAEEGEDFLTALMALRKYCGHIHFANCNIREKDNPLYGDKHLGFFYPNTEWSPEKLKALFGQLEKLYSADTVRIGIETLCREDDPYKYFDETWKMLDFLH